MEDTERYLNALRRSDTLIKKLLNTLEEDKQNICNGMSGEAEAVYLKQTDQVIDEIKRIQRKIRLLYSESSAG